MKWHQRFLELAKHISAWSKDPSTKVGAIVVDNNNLITGMGYNGFAPGVDDSPERYLDRDVKYKMVIHGEMNAILSAKQTEGCTLYTWPFGCCSNCAAMVIKAGIRCVVHPPITKELEERWGDALRLARLQFDEAGVEQLIIPSTRQIMYSDSPAWIAFVAYARRANVPLNNNQWRSFLAGWEAA